jgi:hypothetical protein
LNKARAITGITIATLLLSFLSAAAFRTAADFAGLFRLSEIGYGDSYILYDIINFQKTGILYRDLSLPPYLPTQYSPLMYRLYALAASAGAGNPFFGPRLIALGSFLACVAMVVSIVRALVPLRRAGWWGLCVATSFQCMLDWPLQLRSDFPAAFFALSALRLILSGSRYSVLFAGLCAGLALQFKITFLAALATGSVWLLIHKQWSRLAVYLASAVTTSAGLYLLFWLHEPRMISQMLALSPGVWDPFGSLRMLVRVFSEPAVLVALPALWLIITRRTTRWDLLVLYTSISLGLSTITAMQAGANINYFFEALFALTPLAVFGILQIISSSGRNAGLAVFLMAVLVIEFWIPQLREIRHRGPELKPDAVQAENETFRRTEDILRGRHFFSTIPRLALLDPEPALMEPYLFSYQMKLGKINPEPLLDRVAAGEFDLVITPLIPAEWRGVRHGSPGLDRAIAAAYRPFCTLSGNVWQLPRMRSGISALTRQLIEIGCVP